MKANLINKSDRYVRIFLDDNKTPFIEHKPPLKFELDTSKIPDGMHKLKIVAKSSDGVEGVKNVSFEVRNGPSISVVGLKDQEIVDHKIDITVNAYGSENKENFIIEGSETPKAIPGWLWAAIMFFIAFGIFYMTMYWDSSDYVPFF